MTGYNESRVPDHAIRFDQIQTDSSTLETDDENHGSLGLFEPPDNATILGVLTNTGDRIHVSTLPGPLFPVHLTIVTQTAEAFSFQGTFEHC